MTMASFKKFDNTKLLLFLHVLKIDSTGISGDRDAMIEALIKKRFSESDAESDECFKLHNLVLDHVQESGENLLHYADRMQNTFQYRVAEDALVAYIIAGIQDNPNNKRLLYSARNICELKYKYKAYIKSKRCTHCNIKGHDVSVCWHKHPQYKKCYHCGVKGHTEDCYISKEIFPKEIFPKEKTIEMMNQVIETIKALNLGVEFHVYGPRKTHRIIYYDDIKFDET